MVVVSDNTATNLLIETVGMEKVTRRMSELGLKRLAAPAADDRPRGRASEATRTSAHPPTSRAC